MKTLRLLVTTLVLAGCSGGGCGGITIEAIPDGGRYQGEKIDNAMNVRLSSQGLATLSSNYELILDYFAPGKQLVTPLRCSTASIALLGSFAIADQGSAGCTSEACGQLDGVCDYRDEPVQIVTTFNGMTLTPMPPDSVEVGLDVTIQTGKIMVDSIDRTHITCLNQDPLKCGLDFDTNRSATAPASASNVIRANVKVEIDTRWDRIVRFDVGPLGGSAVCGTSGALPRPDCVDPDDVAITSEGPCKTCVAGTFDAAKSFLLTMLVDEFKKSVEEAINYRSCVHCASWMDPCPQNGTSTSTCSVPSTSWTSGLCIDDQTNKCVPGLIGLEGRLPLGAYLSPLSAPASAMLDFGFAMGGSVAVDTGVTAGVRGGSTGSPVSDCVAPLPKPGVAGVFIPNFDLDAPGPYDLGMSISSAALNTTLFEARQSGAMCLGITQFDSGLFRAVIPSLGKLIGASNVETPMLLTIRPKSLPRAVVGRGTYDTATNRPLDPLLKLEFENLSIDFYALLEDRYVRLFNLTSDVSLPLSLAIEGCSTVVPVVGDLVGAFTNVRATGNELLAEDITVLESLVPTFVALAEPQLAGALPGFTLPSMGEFKFKLLEARGVGLFPGSNAYEHMGLYANIVLANASCAVSAPSVEARLLRSKLPELTALRGQPLPWPEAVLSVRVVGATGEAEYSVRVDGGLWSEFRKADAPGELHVSHPAFLLQKHHEIQVRARLSKAPNAFSAPVEVGFAVDLEPPSVSLRPDREKDLLIVEASDSMSQTNALEYAYRLGDGQWSQFGPARLVVLSEAEAAGSFAARVRDEAGRVGEASYRTPSAPLRDLATATSSGAPASGCSSLPGSTSLLALAVALLALKRR